MKPSAPDFDPSRPNEARVIDYILGGKDNFAADRAAADQALELAPELPMMAREARKFLRRAVRFLAGSGIVQFIDIGCGLPTQGNVHEVAQAASPGARVVYVDNDPVVITHAKALLVNDGSTTVINADMRSPEEIIDHPELHRLIDLDRPVGVLLVSVLAAIPEDDVIMKMVEYLCDRIAPGSHLVFSHAIRDTRPEVTARLASLYQDEQIVRNEVRRGNLRSRAEIEPFFAGLEFVEPGIVNLPAWRPDPGEPAVLPGAVWAVGGVGRRN